jgi:hypothetical protein
VVIKTPLLQLLQEVVVVSPCLSNTINTVFFLIILNPEVSDCEAKTSNLLLTLPNYPLSCVLPCGQRLQGNETEEEEEEEEEEETQRPPCHQRLGYHQWQLQGQRESEVMNHYHLRGNLQLIHPFLILLLLLINNKHFHHHHLHHLILLLLMLWTEMTLNNNSNNEGLQRHFSTQ